MGACRWGGWHTARSAGWCRRAGVGFELSAFGFTAPFVDIVFAFRAYVIEPNEVFELWFGGWYLCHGIHRSFKLAGPYFLQLSAGGEVHSHRVGFDVVEADKRAVLIVYRIIYGANVAHRFAFSKNPLFKVGEHIARGDLIEVDAVGHLLDGECLPQYACFANGRVGHVDEDFLSEQLPASVPYDGIAVHGEARVFRVDDHRVAHGLNVVSVGSYL